MQMMAIPLPENSGVSVQTLLSAATGIRAVSEGLKKRKASEPAQSARPRRQPCPTMFFDEKYDDQFKI